MNNSETNSLYPRPEKQPTERRLHGQILKDDFAWFRDRDNPKVLDYLRAENAFTDCQMRCTEALREQLFEEMRSRIQETDESYPVPLRGYLYYTRTEKDRAYPIYCRRMQEGGDEEILLDLNVLAEGKAYLNLGAFALSPDQRLLAYALDENGSEVYTVFIKDLSSGKLFPDRIENAATGLVWAEDGKTVLYTSLDETHRPDKVWLHRLGADASNDSCIFHDPDGAFFVGVEKTADRKYLLISADSKTMSEQWYVTADTPDQPLKVIQPRTAGLEYAVEHHAGYWYVLTNKDAVNFQLMKTPVEKPGQENWQSVLAPRDSVKLEDIEVFQSYLAVLERDQGQLKIRVRAWDESAFTAIEFPEAVNTVWFENNPEYESRTLFLGYSSLTTPRSVYAYALDTGELELKKRQPVLGSFNEEDYATERLEARADDGTAVPISLVYKKNLKQTGPQALLLYGYGAYGISMDPAFSAQRLSLLDRGFIFAIAHIRGGGDLGRPWYEAGKWLQKKNTFTDFIACAEHLIAEGWTDADQLAVAGGSAGGLLIGAVVNQRPDLFHAAILDVPFVDVLNTMLDPSLPLTVAEYEEWGNPEEPEYFDYIRSYSPYDQIEAQAYPHLLVTGGLNDPRVQYWEPAKLVAKVRELNTSDNLVLLKMEMDYGHGGASGRYDFLKEIAFEYAFILRVFGLIEPGNA